MTLPCRPSPSHPFQRQTFPPHKEPIQQTTSKLGTQGRQSAARARVQETLRYNRPIPAKSGRAAGPRRWDASPVRTSLPSLRICENRWTWSEAKLPVWNWQFFFVLGRRKRKVNDWLIRSHKWKFSTKIVPPQFSTRYSRVPAESVLQSEASLP